MVKYLIVLLFVALLAYCASASSCPELELIDLPTTKLPFETENQRLEWTRLSRMLVEVSSWLEEDENTCGNWFLDDMSFIDVFSYGMLSPQLKKIQISVINVTLELVNKVLRHYISTLTLKKSIS
jgi:hypothetical protein